MPGARYTVHQPFAHVPTGCRVLSGWYMSSFDRFRRNIYVCCTIFGTYTLAFLEETSQGCSYTKDLYRTAMQRVCNIQYIWMISYIGFQEYIMYAKKTTMNSIMKLIEFESPSSHVRQTYFGLRTWVPVS